MAPKMEQTNKHSEVSGAGKNPWANDYVLMSLSLWWVQKTSPSTSNFDQEVASTMASLKREFRSAA